MVESITQRLIRFLEIHTNYALLINGEYGIGKTYYIKNELFPKVHKTAVPTSINDKIYHPVLISLFGIRSVEEIKKHLFLELFPLLKNNSVKFTSDIELFLKKMFCKVDTEQFINNENTSTSEVKHIKKILFCFDDINRKSDDLQIKELFGFINNILENSNIKVILIANEEELINADVDYLQIKEKVIGTIIKFKTDVPLIYKQIITTKYKEKLPNYFNFLNKHSQGVISKIEENNSNLITLIFFLDHYEIIFNSIEKFLKNDKEPKLSDNECFYSTFNFALSLSIEFKMGVFTPDIIYYLKQKFNGGQLPKSPIEGDLTQKELEVYEEINTYTENYEEKYFFNINYNPIAFFNSIFDFIVGNSSFIIENLMSELKPRYRINKRYSKFDILFKLEVLDLSRSEIDNLIDKMLNLVDKAEFRLGEYPDVFSVAARFLNLYEGKKKDRFYTTEREKIVNRFKKGIDKWVLNYNPLDYPEFIVNLEEQNRLFDEKELRIYNPFNIDFEKSLFHATLFEVYGFGNRKNAIEIKNYCQEVYYKIISQNEKEEIKSLFELYKKDILTFTEKISEPYTQLRYYPIYSKFNFDEFWSILKKAKNSQLVEFGFHLKQRYQPKYIQF